MSQFNFPDPPRIILGNGLHIVNFSSPHPFHFITGEQLPACDTDRASRFPAITSEEEERQYTQHGSWSDSRSKRAVTLRPSGN